MAAGKRMLRLWKRVRKLNLSSTKIIALVFAGIIFLIAVIWLVGGRMSSHVKVTETTKTVIEIEYIGGNEYELR